VWRTLPQSTDFSKPHRERDDGGGVFEFKKRKSKYQIILTEAEMMAGGDQ
jgi:hypothetical protein